MHSFRGFTLIELMVTVAILAIVLTLAVPSFTRTIQNNRMASLADEIGSAIQLTRSEAVTRRRDVVLCHANSAGTACQNGTDWSNGWLILQLDDPVESGDDSTLIRLWSPPTDTTVTAPNAGGLTFKSNGLPKSGDSGVFSTTPLNCSNGQKRTITVSNTGHTTLAKTTCTPS